MTDQDITPTQVPINRRRFLGWAGTRGVALGVAGVGLPALLAACGDDDPARPSTTKTAYLGKGMLLEPVDTSAMTATFKLGQCYPGSRYFVLDHSVAPMAEGTFTSFSPRLQTGPSEAGATGRTNVFMNGIEGPGRMGFQPSAFDFTAGDPVWSPYWDHWTYAWKDGVEPRLITSQTEIHEARDAGDLDEFPGVPETNGEIFTVNCPVPVLAPNTFEPA